MTTEERLEQVENELARGKRRSRYMLSALTLSILGAALIWTLMRAMPASEAQVTKTETNVVVATMFVLEDESGRVRARLGFFEGGPDPADMPLLQEPYGPGLELYDETGQVRARIGLWRDEPRIILHEKTGKVAAMFSGDSLSIGGPGVLRGAWLSSDGTTSRLWLGGIGGTQLTVGEDMCHLTLRPTKSRGRIYLTTEDGPGLGFYDENGKVRAMLTALKEGPALWLSDEKGELRAALSVLKDGPGLTLGDEKGNTIWSAP